MPWIGRAEAVALAEAAVLDAGLPWENPVSVTWGPFHYMVWTNSGVRDANTIVRVNRCRGVVTSVSRTGRRAG